jgi:site-specific DNA recombinase
MEMNFGKDDINTQLSSHDFIKKHRKSAELLLFTMWGRFSRNAADAYGMINTFKRCNIEPHAIERPLDLSIPENKIMLAVYLAVPEVENDRRALNVSGGMRKTKKDGRWMATAPKSYKNVRIDNMPNIVPTKMPGMYNGFSMKSIIISNSCLS